MQKAEAADAAPRLRGKSLLRKALRVSLWLLVAAAGAFLVLLVIAFLSYPAEYVLRVFAWGDSDVFDWQKFPSHPLHAASTPYRLAEMPDSDLPALFADLAAAPDWEAFLEENHTQSLVVVHDGAIAFEGYFNGAQRDSIVTSFSVAKSFTSALIGIAIGEGYITSADDPITKYLPELAVRDPRFGDITIRDLLLMASGLEYEEFRLPGLNSDDPLTTYYPDQRWLALNNTHVLDPSGAYFQYNKYHPQLLGLILERTTGMTPTEYLQTRIWDPLGMQYGGSWSTDSEASDFEKMETGINARAIDFAKFGQLYLQGGNWNGVQVVPAEWVAQSTQPYLPDDYSGYYPEWFADFPGQGYYGLMWWGIAREDGGYDFTAEGDKGQFIYVSPDRSLVIARNGIDYGISFFEWLQLFSAFASQY